MAPHRRARNSVSTPPVVASSSLPVRDQHDFLSYSAPAGPSTMGAALTPESSSSTMGSALTPESSSSNSPHSGNVDAAGASGSSKSSKKKKLAGKKQARAAKEQEPKDKGPSKGFVFISSDPSQKHSEDTRRSIRSHVMLGKNKMKQPLVKPRQSSWIDASSQKTALQGRRNVMASEGQNAGGVLRIGSASSPGAGPSGSGSQSEEEDTTSVILLDQSRWELTLPLSMGHDLRSFHFAEELSLNQIGLLTRYFTSLGASQFPLPGVIELDPGAQCWFYWTAEDSAYLNMMLCATSVFNDIAVARKNMSKLGDMSQLFSRKSRFYLNRTLNLLTERLKDYDLALTDSTFASVTSLTIISDFLADGTASRAHAAGLREMVRLRGGIASLSHNCHLQAKVCRADIQSSIAMGDKPHLFDEATICWDSFWDGLSGSQSSAGRLPPGPTPHDDISSQLDARLVTVYRDLREFARLVNFVPQLGRKIKATLFSELMISVQYRLLNLSYSLGENPLAECMRLSLLVFCCPVFLQFPGMRVQYSNLFQRFRAALKRLDATNSSVAVRRFKFWVLMVGSIAVFNLNEEWLLPALRALLDPGMASKERALAALKETLWVNCVFDRPGQMVLEMVFENRGRVTEASL